jgi:hypothetical protein
MIMETLFRKTAEWPMYVSTHEDGGGSLSCILCRDTVLSWGAGRPGVPITLDEIGRAVDRHIERCTMAGPDDRRG